jgi:hypothetical protein
MRKDDVYTSAKLEYTALSENGELLELFPNFSGTWAKDKSEFLKYHEMNEQILRTSRDLDLEEGFEGIYGE